MAQCDGYFNYELMENNLVQWKLYWKSGAMWHNVTVINNRIGAMWHNVMVKNRRIVAMWHNVTVIVI